MYTKIHAPELSSHMFSLCHFSLISDSCKNVMIAKDKISELNRVIIHVDLDCFYCQVEQIRLQMSFDVPFVVQQWGSLIAVNYAARAFGVKRFMLLSEAQRLCPNLRWAHTATIALGSSEPRYHESPAKSTHKVSLEPYRMASEKIHAVLRRVAGSDCPYERAGTDEAYIDISARVAQNLLSNTETVESWPGHFGTLLKEMTDDEAPLGEWFYAAKVCFEMRQAVKLELGYNCSAGVSRTKILSKLLSARYKPNQQATLAPSGVRSFMHDINIQQVRGFGGQFGAKIIASLQLKTCGEILEMSRADMLATFDDSTVDYIVRACRGEDVEESVKEKPRAKSLLAAKNFPPTTEIMPWVHVLIAELHQRVAHFVRKHSNSMEFFDDKTKSLHLDFIYPKTITVVLKWISIEDKSSRASSGGDTCTKTFPFRVTPKVLLAPNGEESEDKRSRFALLQNVLSGVDMLRADSEPKLSFRSLSIAIHSFVDLSMSPASFWNDEHPRHKSEVRNATLDTFMRGFKRNAEQPADALKSETDASGRTLIDLT